MNDQKSQTSSLTYILIGIVIVLLIQYLSSNNQDQSSSATSQQNDAAVDPYEECITWQETDYYDGETVCIIGKVIFVDNSFDELSGQTIWGARFSMADNTFHLVSVGHSLDQWQGKCVVIRGTLRDRSEEEPEFRNGPWMINSEFSSDFTIREAPIGLCQ
jgi:hypothetical protein